MSWKTDWRSFYYADAPGPEPPPLEAGATAFLVVDIQNKYMETPWLRAAFQVLLGGSLVFAAGILIGNA